MSDTTTMVRAFEVLAKRLHRDVNGMLRDGFRYLGTSGADHVIRDPEGRVYVIDLVVGRAIQCAGLPPKIDRPKRFAGGGG